MVLVNGEGGYHDNEGMTAPTEWTILVPLKATSRGKSRLEMTPEMRRRLAMAMAMDTVSAAAECGQVLVVVEDDADAAALGAMADVRVHRTEVTGLNESIRDGLRLLSSEAVPAEQGPVVRRFAVLPGDLPGLQSAELGAVLRQSESYRFAVVADHQQIGTTLLAARTTADLRPAYGSDSFRRHQLLGAVALSVPPESSLRWDVDTAADLNGGVGLNTTAALTALRTN